MYFIREADEKLLVHHAVDRNQLPGRLLQRIDILTDECHPHAVKL